MATHLDSPPDAALSPQQAHLLRIGAGLRPDVFCVEASLDIAGDLDATALLASLAELTAGCDVLHTRYESGEPQGARSAGEAVDVERFVSTLDLTLASPSDRDEALRSLACSLRYALTDLAPAPSWRAALVTLSATEHRLLLALPALNADACSVEHLMAALAHAYSARLRGERHVFEGSLVATLHALRDVGHGQGSGRDSRDEWRARIEAAPRTIRLPFDAPFAEEQPFLPEEVRRTVDARTLARLTALAAELEVSQRALLLAAWRILLWRTTGGADVVIGLACEGRTFGQAFDAIGPIDTCVPLALGLGAEDSLADVAARAEETITDSRRGQRAFSWEEHEAGLDSPPYFPVTFELHPAPRVTRAGETVFSLGSRRGCTDRFDLGLVCDVRRDSLETALCFDAGRIERAQVEDLAESLEVLLAGACDAPRDPVPTLPLLSGRQRRRILEDFNPKDGPLAAGPCIHERIAEHAAQTPARAAVLFQDEELTYGDLEARANQLAHHLQERGVGAGVFVAIHAEPSLEMMIAIIGILKAGGAYVPLDPENPAERLAWVLEDTGAPVLLTLGRLASLPVREGVHVLRLDDEWDAVAGQPETPPATTVGPEDLAYSIYTSGSTGNPKGVLVTHANLWHSTEARVRYYGGRVGRYLLLSSFAFDSSVAGIFWTWLDGGALVLPAAGTQRDPRRVAELIARHRVTHGLCLASHYALILSHGEPESFASMETQIVSGEVISTALVDRHDAIAPNARLFNEYGPTEGSVWSTVFDCHDPFPGNQIPIGHPIARTSIHVLDARMEPVPIGAPGEMYQGGAGVTLGYLNRPDLTEKAFVPDPFSNEPGARLYRTGDLARYLSSGDVEFLGRVDHQVKLRGYRIELGEIEAVLARNEGLREVAVLCREDEPGERYLAAYFVARPGSPVEVPAMRERLAETLPAYMIPYGVRGARLAPAYATIGKLDTSALPVPRNETARGLTTEYVAPRDAPGARRSRSSGRSALDRERHRRRGRLLRARRALAPGRSHRGYRIRESLALEVPQAAERSSMNPTISGMTDG